MSAISSERPASIDLWLKFRVPTAYLLVVTHVKLTYCQPYEFLTRRGEIATAA